MPKHEAVGTWRSLVLAATGPELKFRTGRDEPELGAAEEMATGSLMATATSWVAGLAILLTT